MTSPAGPSKIKPDPTNPTVSIKDLNQSSTGKGSKPGIKPITIDPLIGRLEDAARLRELGLYPSYGVLGQLQNGEITRGEAARMGWTSEFFSWVNWDADGVVKREEFLAALAVIERSAKAYGVSLKQMAALYMKARRFYVQDFDGITRAREGIKTDIKNKIEELRADPSNGNMTDAELFLKAIKELKLVGMNGEVLREMKAYVEANPGASEDALFPFYGGLIGASDVSAELQNSIFHVNNSIRRTKDGHVTGGIGSPWSGRAIDYRPWYRGEESAIGDREDGDPGAEYDMQWLEQKWRYSGNFRKMQNLLSAKSWRAAQDLIDRYIGELRQILVLHPGSGGILSEINEWFIRLLNVILRDEGRSGERGGASVRTINTLVTVAKNSKPDFSRLDNVLGIIEDYMTFISGYADVYTPESLSLVFDYYNIISASLIRKMGKAKDKCLEKAKAILGKQKAILGLIESEEVAQESNYAHKARAQFAMQYVSLASVTAKDEENDYLSEVFKLVDNKSPDEYKIHVYVGVFEHLVKAGKYDDAISLLGYNKKSFKGHTMPKLDKRWDSFDEIARILDNIRHNATKIKHGGGWFHNDNLKKAIDWYKGEVTGKGGGGGGGISRKKAIEKINASSDMKEITMRVLERNIKDQIKNDKELTFKTWKKYMPASLKEYVEGEVETYLKGYFKKSKK